MVISTITFVSEELISERCWKDAYELTKDVDEDDTPFIALAMELNAYLWTGDKVLTKGLQAKGSDIIVDTAMLKNLNINRVVEADIHTGISKNISNRHTLNHVNSLIIKTSAASIEA